MPVYLYRAFDRSVGRTVAGNVEAASRADATHKLVARGLGQVYVEPVRAQQSSRHVGKDGPLPPGATLEPPERMAFYANLSLMLGSGIPLPRALDSLAEQMPSRRSRAVVEGLSVRLCRGMALAAAMEALAPIFGRLERAAVHAGETSGDLPTMLDRLARHQERNLSLTRHVRSALLYPLFVFAAAVMLIAVLAHFMVSGILPVLQQSHLKLPTTSSWLVGLLRLSQSPWCIALGLALIFSLLWTGRYLLREHRSWVDYRLLRLPLLGEILRKIDVVRFCEALSTLYSCGIPLTVGLRSVQDMVWNTEVRRLVGDAIDGIVDGRELSEMLAGPLFPPAVVSMVSVGEHTGRLDLMLDKVAAYLDVEVRTAVEGCAAALEPIMIVMLGGVVTFIILTAFAPLYQLLAQLG